MGVSSDGPGVGVGVAAIPIGSACGDGGSAVSDTEYHFGTIECVSVVYV